LNGKGFKILLEILARLNTSRIKEVPYTFRPRTLGESKLSSKVVLQYFQQLWRLSSASRYLSDQFLKFAVVGGIGVFTNLAVMALLLRLASSKGWQASAIASLVANAQNYILNNIWTFADHSHKGFRRLKGYLSYLIMSAAGLVVTTGSYAGLVWFLSRASLLDSGPSASGSVLRLACQFVAVLSGMCFNYELNKTFTWREVVLSVGRRTE
jgi:dolichol-phosphate mannosyltransferase